MYLDIVDFGGTSGCEKYFSQKDNGFLDDAFGKEREIVREPSVDPAFERANPDDSFGSQQQRHTGTVRFVGSRTVENTSRSREISPWRSSISSIAIRSAPADHLRKRLDIHGLAQVHD
ncbi:MAG TPA: hypothetical protein VF089_02100 [Candidatus Binatia bacterium]